MNIYDLPNYASWFDIVMWLLLCATVISYNVLNESFDWLFLSIGFKLWMLIVSVLNHVFHKHWPNTFEISYQPYIRIIMMV